MVDAPERIWTIGAGSVASATPYSAGSHQSIEYVRADLARIEASAAVKVDTIRPLLSYFEELERLPAEKHPHYPSGFRPWRNGDVKSIAYDLRTILSALSPAPQEAEAVVDECEREDQIDALPHPDGAHVAEILAYVLSCARLWQPEARIIGNARAGDIVRALTHPPAPAVTEEAELWTGEGDGFKSFTLSAKVAERWRKGNLKVTPYAALTAAQEAGKP